jgi:hypothetical protein
MDGFLRQIVADSGGKLTVGGDGSLYDAFQGFRHAIRWTEVSVRPTVTPHRNTHSHHTRVPLLPFPSLLLRQPLILSILLTHVVIATVVVVTRRHANVQIGLFLVVCALAYASERLNEFNGRNWRRIGWTQNYFDPRGVFATCMWSGPLLVVAGGQMVSRAGRGGRGRRRGRDLGRP